jgi:hypothetical protein
MNWNAKKLGPSAALSLIAGSSLLFADNGDDARMRNLESRITAIECRNNCCAMVNPPARPFAKDTWGFYVAIDPLLWQAHENGLPVGIVTGGPGFNNSGTNKVKNPHFEWSWGFRLTGGLNLECDGWDTALTWTRWNTTAKTHFSAGQNNEILPTAPTPLNAGLLTAGHASARWRLHLNVLDWELGREFYVSRCLTLRPMIGLRSAWISQKFRATYDELPVIVSTEDVKDRERCKYWGLGPLGGIDTQWGLGCGWSIFGNYSASLLYGFFKTPFRERLDTVVPPNIKNRTKNFYHVGRAISDMQIGLRYDWLACDECYHLGVEAGWEHHMFWGQNQFMVFVNDIMPGKFIANQGDLTTQGYFVRVRFDF